MSRTGYSIRPVRKSDSAHLGRLFDENNDRRTLRTFTPFPLTAETASAIAGRVGRDRYYVAIAGEMIVGLGMLRGWDEGYDIPALGVLVHHEYRALGIGRSLSETAIAEAARLGAPAVRLSVHASNERALRLYESLGFREQDRQPVIVAGEPDERIVMVKRLERTKVSMPLAAPVLDGNERRYVMDCLDSTWISSIGPYIGRFERTFADFCGVSHAVSCCNGTAALHLALLATGIGPGDEVLVPTLTYVATANAVRYCGAKPVFVDSEPASWNLDTKRLEEAITSRTKAVIAVHLYGHPVDMIAIRAIAGRHRIAVIEDAAEAHGAEVDGERVGALGDIATFSFYGNKILTSGEGGMVVTRDDERAGRVRQLRGQGLEPGRHYWFPMVGYNYRMTNVAAAIGLAQLERVEWHLQRRAEIAGWYREELAECPAITWQRSPSHIRPVDWLVTLMLDDGEHIARDAVIAALAARGIETRPAFYPLHTLPPYREGTGSKKYPVAERIGRLGLSLPTWVGMSREDVSWICDSLKTAVAAQGENRGITEGGPC